MPEHPASFNWNRALTTRRPVKIHTAHSVPCVALLNPGLGQQPSQHQGYQQQHPW